MRFTSLSPCILLITFVLASGAAAQESSKKSIKSDASASDIDTTQSISEIAAILPTWSVGDVRHYSMRKWRVQDGVDAASQKRGLVTPLTVEIVDTADGRFHVAWTTEAGRFEDGSAVDLSEVPEHLAALARGYRVVLELDDTYTPVAVVNYDELSARLLAVFDEILSTSGGSGSKTGERAASAVFEQFSRREVLEPLMMKEPTAFFVPVGQIAIVGDTNVTEAALPNPLGGEPFPVMITTLLSSIDSSRSEATFHTAMTFEPEAAARIIGQFLRRIGGKEMTLDVKEALRVFNIVDNATYVANLETGWVVRMHHTRTITTQGMTREEHVEIVGVD